jgi:predicted dehydrogenase
MKEPSTQNLITRRDFIANTGKIAAVSALAGAAIPYVHAAEKNTIQVALIGCGGRGTGAAQNALSVKNAPVKLVAMADVFEDRLRGSFNSLSKNFSGKMDVPQDRRFVGLDSYKQAMDCLKPGDIAISATPPAFRWVHMQYALSKNLNMFMEKPVTVDAPTSRRMFEMAKEATAKNLKMGVGLMSRHSVAMRQLAERIQNGELGELILQRGYRMHGPIGFFASPPKPADTSDLMYQIRRFHSFLWASGGSYSDFYIHIIDHQSWMKNAWPVSAHALGGRHYRTSPEGTPQVDQNFDIYAVEYTFPDGTKLDFDGRCMNGCHDEFASYAHGTKGMAIVSASGDCGMPSRIFKGQTAQRSNMLWESKVNPDERDPYQNEWNALIDAVMNDKPFNEVERGVRASLVTSMGRMAAHTGQIVRYDDILNCEHEFAPGLDKLTADSPPPLIADSNGRYPVPMPGIKRDREY